MKSAIYLVAAPAVVAVLGCGGLAASVAPGDHLRAVCDAQPAVAIPDDLALVPITSGAPVPRGVPIEVRAKGLLVDGRNVAAADLRAEVARSAQLRGERVAVVVVDPELSASSGIEVLVAARDAGLADIAVVGASGEPWDLPPWPDPALAEEVLAELAGQDPATRAVLLAERMQGAVAACPGAADTFAAVAHAAPEQRCPILAVGLDESLPTCLLTDADRVTTLAQVAVTPTRATPPAVLRFTLDPAGAPISMGAEAQWRDVMSELDRRRPATAWLDAALGD
jgi:hypothetical protein